MSTGVRANMTSVLPADRLVGRNNLASWNQHVHQIASGIKFHGPRLTQDLQMRVLPDLPA